MVTRDTSRDAAPLPARRPQLPSLLGLLWLAAAAGACGTVGSGERAFHPVATATADGRVELKVGPPVDVAAMDRRWAPVAEKMREGMGDGAFRDMMREYDRTHPLHAVLHEDGDLVFYRAQLRCRSGPVMLPTGCVTLTIRLPDGRLVTCRDQGIIARIRGDESRIQDSRVRPVILSAAWDPAAAADGIFKLLLRCAARGEVVGASLDESLLGRRSTTETGRAER